MGRGQGRDSNYPLNIHLLRPIAATGFLLRNYGRLSAAYSALLLIGASRHPPSQCRLSFPYNSCL